MRFLKQSIIKNGGELVFAKNLHVLAQSFKLAYRYDVQKNSY